jgi:hypothetical protein
MNSHSNRPLKRGSDGSVHYKCVRPAFAKDKARGDLLDSRTALEAMIGNYTKQERRQPNTCRKEGESLRGIPPATLTTPEGYAAPIPDASAVDIAIPANKYTEGCLHL